MPPDNELLAVKLSALAREIGCEIRNQFSCARVPFLTENSIPENAVPFAWRGAVPQTAMCHVAVQIARVPRGHRGYIKHIAFSSRYPGAMYGAHYHLLRGEGFEPTFARVNHAVGSVAVPMAVHIPLEENDVIGIMIQCNHMPIVFGGMESTYVQTAFPYVIQGYTYPLNSFVCDPCTDERNNILEI